MLLGEMDNVSHPPPDIDGLPRAYLHRLCDSKFSPKSLILLAHPTRFERVTFAFGGQRSIQLSYGCFQPPFSRLAGGGQRAVRAIGVFCAAIR